MLLGKCMTGRLADSATRTLQWPQARVALSFRRAAAPKAPRWVSFVLPLGSFRVRMKILWNIDGIHLYDLFHSREVNILHHLDLNPNLEYLTSSSDALCKRFRRHEARVFGVSIGKKLHFCGPIKI